MSSLRPGGAIGHGNVNAVIYGLFDGTNITYLITHGRTRLIVQPISMNIKGECKCVSRHCW